jgi:hypothetical protein
MENITTLNIFYASQNFTIGNFPLGLGKSRRLTTLNASSNEFTGPLPEDLGSFTSL